MLSKLFGFDPSKHSIKTEVMAGITTFLTMAYILAVNPSIFANLASKGMDTNAVFTSTALAAIVGTLVMAIYAKKPFGLAPGMALTPSSCSPCASLWATHGSLRLQPSS